MMVIKRSDLEPGKHYTLHDGSHRIRVECKRGTDGVTIMLRPIGSFLLGFLDADENEFAAVDVASHCTFWQEQD